MNDSRLSLMIALAGLLLAACSTRPGAARPDLLTPLRPEFEAADRDGDDMLTREEAVDMPKLTKVFDEVDTDRNGRVSTGELRSYLEWQRVLATPRGRFPETRPQ